MTDITIITPVYNRQKEIQRLYRSLLNQTVHDFEWLIVDDGSTDDIRLDYKKWSECSTFTIKYIYQENGGKHRALNKGIKEIDTPFTFIVDSDDYITDDAIEIIEQDILKIKNDSHICGIGYLRGYSSKHVIGDRYPDDHVISDFISMRFNRGVNGDKAEVWRTADLKKTPFPEFDGERFISEGYVWCSLALKKKMLFINKIIYITEYLDGGLSKSGRSLRVKCPLGGMASAEMMMHKPFNYNNRIKGALLYVAYGKIAGKHLRDLVKDTNAKSLTYLSYIPGSAIYMYWRKYI